MPPSIRPAIPHDAAAIAGIHVRTWRSAYRGLLPDAALNAMTPEQRQPGWDRLLRAPPADHAVLVAEADGRVIGFCSTGRTRDGGAPTDTFELFTLYVEPDAQGQGAGGALLRAGEAEMRRAGAERAVLWVLEGNENALRFYRHHGWWPTGEAKREMIFGVVARNLCLVKELARAA